MNKEQIEKLMIDYLSNADTGYLVGVPKEEEIRQLLYEYEKAFTSLECTPEGFTKEQEEKEQALEKEYFEKLCNLCIGE